MSVYWYSQTGQLHETVSAFVTPLTQAGVAVEWHEIKPRRPYPFPWPLRTFFELFPTVADPDVTIDLEPPPGPPGRGCGLVVLGFQVWYLSASLPARSLADSGIFRGHHVVGVTACRNMWYSAALDLRHRLTSQGARYVGTVSAVDSAPAAVTFVTTLRWLLRGRRDGFWRFPPAGVGQAELDRVRAVGENLARALTRPAGPTGSAGPASSNGPAGWDWGERTALALASSPSARIDAVVAAADLIGGTVFRRWGGLIRHRRTRAAWRAALWSFAAALAGGITTLLPAFAIVNAIVPGRLRAAVRSRLAPALAAESVRA